MKRLIHRLNALAATAVLMALLHPPVAVASPVSRDVKNTPAAPVIPHSAMVQPAAAAPGQKPLLPYAHAHRSTGQPASLADKEQLSRREHFLTALRNAGVTGSKRLALPATPQASPSSLGINFPGFSQAAVFTHGVAPQDPNNAIIAVSADVNHDGLPDIVNVQIDGTINVMLNPGKGNLSQMAVSSVNTTGAGSRYITDAQAVDLNGDGYPEIVLADVYASNLLIFPNNKGTFGSVVSVPLNFASGQSFGTGGGLVFGDFNGDGIIDIASFLTVYGYSSDNQPQTGFELLVLPGKGDGTFGAALPEQYTLINAFATTQPGQVTLADVNGDGKPDIVYLIGGFDEGTHSNGELWVDVLFGKGDGTFSNPTVNIPDSGAIAPVDGNGGLVGGITVQDIDGDGNLDVLFTNCTDQTLYYARGNGDGTFQNSTTPITRLGYPNYIAFADVTGDGIVDVISYGIGFTAVYPGQGKGVYGSPINYVGGLTGLIEPAPADFDGDGKLDIASTDAATDMTWVQLQTTAGTLAASPVLSPPNESASLFQVIATGNFNGDSYPDVLALDYSTYWGNEQNAYPYPDIKVGINDGKGNFTYSTAVGNSALRTFDAADVDSGLILPKVADFNGDNIDDFIVGGEDGSLWVVLSTGPGTYAAPQKITMAQSYQCHFSRADVGDVNGDGKKDVVLAYGGDAGCSGGTIPSGVLSMISNGDGTFTQVFTAIGSSAYLPRLIDFNGDGKLDLALSDIAPYAFTFNFYIVPGNGDGSFNATAATDPLPSGTGVTAIIPGDFDGDGKQDLTVGVLMRVVDGKFLPDTTGLQTLSGHGDFTFGFPQSYTFGGYPYDGVYADFNGDGRPDLALNVGFNYFVQNPILGNFGYMVNVGGGAFSGFQPGISNDYDVGGFFTSGDFNDYGNTMVADFNGDGAPDVLTVVDYDEEEHYASSLFLNSGAIQFSLTASVATAAQDSPVTLTATLTPTVSTASPSGTVSFYNNGQLLQAVPVSGGTATLPVDSLPVGDNAITATYSGDEHFNAASASTSVAVSITALPPAIALDKPSPSSLTVTAGDSATTSLNLSGNATFAGAVSITCSGAPDKAACTVVPGSVTLAASQSTNVAVLVTTTAPTLTKASSERPAMPWKTGAAGLSLAALLMFAIPGRVRRFRKTWLAMMVLFAGLAGAVSMTGCGGTSTKTVAGTTAGSYTLTVTATAGSVTSSQTISLTVQ